MTSAKSVRVRAATEADRAAIVLLRETGFGMRYGPVELEEQGRLFPVERSLVAVDGDQVVGHTVDITMNVTVPGLQTVRACGVEGVAVAPTHRRRGILRALFTTQHARAAAEGLPLAILTASEATIYGRFGYETTIHDTVVRIDRRRAEFRATTPDPGGVTISTMEAAKSHLRQVYARWQQRTPGAQERPDAKWALLFADPDRNRDGATSLYVLLHADGYALYRRRYLDGRPTVVLWEMRAITTEAHAALWRVLLGMDLVDTVEATLAEDDPLPYLLTDPRAVTLTRRGDALWARVMDVPAALTARSYRHDLDAVVAVHDPFRDAGGTFALRVRDGIAACAPTSRTPDLTCDINVLGGLYFGAHRARDYARAHRISVTGPMVLDDFDAAFATERAPELGWFF
ncbi:GNAT family N-acetyltransferase [Nocardia halotolerans]|uniref:GNAT family N-acetyltransferase n=1 Tax=Nocardia halotolerans TaxID=1755878 RepID=A0ABV8VDS7_9NOCA